jgi:prepilin-type N-terminal cleavage/methylation domain-containing protein
VTPMRRLFVSSCRLSPNGPKATVAKPAAFTLIELLVVVVILSVLASLSLAGLASARQRSKIDKTRSTIRKLHEIVVSQYESYLTRRVSISPGLPDRTAVAKDRLSKLRGLMVTEMPDQWADVYPLASLPSSATAAARRYSMYKQGLSTNPQWSIYSTKYEGAECLAMLVMRGGFDAEGTEQFRNDELGDIDSDGAPEFWDAWGRPIGFIRWAAGFSSVIQVRDATRNPEPLDPFSVSTSLEYPPGVTQRDYGLTPLIYSSGPDGGSEDPLSTSSGYSIDQNLHWLNSLPIYTTRIGSPKAGEPNAAAADNITNHELVTK